MGSALLAGLRVVELGTVVAGPFTASLLADLGADVIKVEPAGQGDVLRRVGPARDGVTALWGVSSRNKRCIGVDLKSPQGSGDMRRLLRDADVLVSNYRPGALARLQLGPADLAALNPRLVHVSISGYGSPGPKSHLPGFGKIAEGMSGIVNLTGRPDEAPLYCGFSLGDTTTALFAALGAVFSLHARDRAGGAAPDVSIALYDALLRITEAQLIEARTAGDPPARQGTNYPYSDGRGGRWPRIVSAQADDGQWLAVLVKNDETAQRFVAEFGSGDPAGPALPEIFEAALRAWTGCRTPDAVRRDLAEFGMEVSLVHDGQTLVGDPYMLARGDVLDVDVAGLGQLWVPGHIDPVMAAKAPRFHWAELADPEGIDWLAPRLPAVQGEFADKALFADLVVVEISDTPGASFAATLFADYGAATYILEAAGAASGAKADAPALWTALARNKHSVIVDPAEGNDLVTELLGRADVVLTDIPRQRWVDHPWLACLLEMPNAPAIVSIFAPGADRPDLWPWSTDPSLSAAASGLMAITGWEDGPPVQPEVPLADYCAGALAALQVAAAVWRGTSRGLVIEEPTHRALSRMIEWQCPAASMLGYPAVRQGNSLPLNMGIGSLCRSSDGKYISVSAVGDKIVANLLRLIGGDAMLNDPRFATMEARRIYGPEVNRLMVEWAALHTADAFMRLAIEHDIVTGIVQDAGGIEQDPQVQARANLVDVRHGSVSLPLVAATPRLEKWTVPIRPVAAEGLADLITRISAGA
jgi:crotonobetainyl-CoA:carnitine CoA-transferase CaiB-like acyl-CoA transferase